MTRASPCLDRRLLLGMIGGGLALLGACRTPRAGESVADDTVRQLAGLEERSGGRLGVALLDTRDGALAGHRLDARFTMCSTFKLSLAAVILREIDAGRMTARLRLPVTPGDPVGHSPVVRAALDRGEREMSILALARAAQVESDNGAANILLRRIGGPAALTAFWRSLGDPVSRLDRYEPELNTSHGDDPRDTTTPAASARTLRTMLLGDALGEQSRATLIEAAIATATGARRLRAGLPAGWRAGDKTGSMWGDARFADKYNDVALVWRPERRAPFIVTAYFESSVRGGASARAEDEAVLAEVGRIAARWMKGRP